MSPVFVNSIGQSGTHLAAKCVELLGFTKVGMATTDPAMDLAASDEIPATQLPGFDPKQHLLRGVDWLGGYSDAAGYEQRWSQRISARTYGASHLFPTPAAVRLFNNLGLKMVLILRDPAGWISSNARISVPPPGEAQKRIQVTVFGRKRPDGDPRMTMVERYQLIAEWTGLPFVHVVRFEDLVGPDGGGTLETQRRAVEAIAAHCGRPVSTAEIVGVSGSLFGGTTTFRSGLADVPEKFQHLLDTPEIKKELAEATAIFEDACDAQSEVPAH